MTTWLQVAVALMSLTAAGLGAYQQVRKRRQSSVSSGVHVAVEKRPGLNGFAAILRQAMDQIDTLRRENEQLRIRVAELEAQAEAKRARRRTTHAQKA